MIINIPEKRTLVRRRAVSRHAFGNARQLERLTILLLLYLIYNNPGYSQSWIRMYGDSSSTTCFHVGEDYDKGYLLVGKRYRPGTVEYGWLMKTDVNGFELWNKMYGLTNYRCPLIAMDKTDDNGSILLGQTGIGGNGDWSAHVIKTDPCGEKIWCRIYHTPGRPVYCVDIKSVPGDGSIAMVGNWGTDPTKTLWLLHLDDNGDIVWEQAYCFDPSVFYDPEGHSLIRTSDTSFIITGSVHSPDSGQTNPFRLRPMIIKVNTFGVPYFQLAWGTNMGFKGFGNKSIDDCNGTIYSGCQSNFYSLGYNGPCLIKTNGYGIPMSYKNLVDSALIGGATTINWFKDSTLAMGLIWNINAGNPYEFLIGVMKTDENGNKIKYMPLIFNGGQAFNDAVTTFNDKLFIVNSDYFTTNWKVQAFKVNSELEFDSIYTTPFTYDSLCPHSIVSDTILLDDCTVVVVGLDDPFKNPETTCLHVFPSPAQSTLTLEIPQYLSRNSSGYGITATTTYHQWKTCTLEIYDLFGKLMYSKEIPQQQKSVQLDVSPWHAGMYVARVVFMNEVVASSKFIVSEQ
jgi:hypothetical protein